MQTQRVDPADHVQALAHPAWDRLCRELRLDSQPVKRFRVPADSQELILDAFQEDGWPRHIDDPLPPIAGQCSKQRLHDAIDRLNRNQINRLIRFRGDGTGRGVLWERIDAPPDRR